MRQFIEKKYLIRRHIISLIAVSLSVYFAYHLMQGERSYPRMVALQNQISAMGQDYQNKTSFREDIEGRVKKMRPDSLDQDLVLEQARHVLGARAKGELDYISY